MNEQKLKEHFEKNRKRILKREFKNIYLGKDSTYFIYKELHFYDLKYKYKNTVTYNFNVCNKNISNKVSKIINSYENHDDYFHIEFINNIYREIFDNHDYRNIVYVSNLLIGFLKNNKKSMKIILNDLQGTLFWGQNLLTERLKEKIEIVENMEMMDCIIRSVEKIEKRKRVKI